MRTYAVVLSEWRGRARAAATAAALAYAGAAGAQGVQPAAAAASASTAVPLNYDLDAGLVYIDALSRPGAAGAADAATPRALGLRRMRAELDWQATRGAALRVVLRPDAVNQGVEGANPPRELDDRSGDPGMQPMPTIRLLDAYQLELAPSASLSASVGVWERLAEPVAAYPQLLGFGLTVMLPAKFSGLNLGWAYRVPAADTAAAPAAAGAPPRLTAQAFVFQGDEDRVETFGPPGRSTRTFDAAPVARDPYYGGAAVVAWTPAPGTTARLLAGYYEASYAATVGTAGAPVAAAAPAAEAAPPADARHAQVFGELAAATLVRAGGREAKLALVGRYAKDTRSGSAAREQLSAMATASVPVLPQLWYLAGAGYGHADRWKPGGGDASRTGTVPLLGYQLETGVLAITGQNLSLEFMVTHEWRVTRDANGASAAGFYTTTPSGTPGATGPFDQPLPGGRSTLQRVGLELTYRLNQNA